MGALGAPPPAARRVLGARGQPRARGRLAAAALRGQAAGLVEALRGARRAGAGAGRGHPGRGQGARPGRRGRAGEGAGRGRRAASVRRQLVGALAGQAGLRVDVRDGPAHHRHPRAFPAALRPPGAGAAAGGPVGAHPVAGGGGAAAGPPGRRCPRRGHRARSARLLPAGPGGEQAGRGRARRGRGVGAGRGAGLAGARLPGARRPDAAADHAGARCCARSTR